MRLFRPSRRPGNELAERLEVSGRTIRRDVERLRQLGYPVDSLSGPAGGYRLRAGSAMPPLLLDDDEAIVIAVGLRTAARASVAGIEETAVRALVKLEQILPAHLRRRVAALGSATFTLPVAGPTVDPQHLTVIAAACRDSSAFGSATEAGWRRKPPRGRAPLARQPWPPLVSRRMGSPPRGLADLPYRPPRQACVDRRALQAAQAAGQRRRRIRRAEHHRRTEPIRGVSHSARPAEEITTRVPASWGVIAPIDAHTASTGRAMTTSDGWHCASRCLASTSRCTSRLSWSSICGR